MGHPAELSGETLSALIALVRKHTGITMTEKKSVLLQGRLRPRLRALALDSYHDYLALIERGGPEVPLFIDMVTTNDTLFFRTPHVWEFFGTKFLPEWFQRHPGATLQIWSAAAASGEEAYSIAMLCQEFQQREAAFRYQITATDISQQMLATGRAGEYGGRSVERIRQSHPQLFERYMTVMPAAGSARVVDGLKKQISFVEHNLLAPLRGGQHFDIVFLRNVLIYFDAEHQEKILGQAQLSMKPEALLILGESESLSRLNTAYRFEMPLIYSNGGVLA
jgi:chemotaxis protein methyltransferase CheR